MTSARLAVPRLEVAVGPDRFHMSTAWVNQPSRPTEISTPHFVGRVTVFVKDFNGVTPDGSPPKPDAVYFEGRSRKFAILIEGKFRARAGVKPYSASEVQFGSDFDYLPDSFPMGPFQAGMKVAQWIDPATHYEFRPAHGRPFIMSPWAACVHTFSAYPSPSALSRAVVLSHDSSAADGVEQASFVPTEAMNDKHKWVERPHWSFLGLKGDPRVDAFLKEHSELLPPSGSSTPTAPPTSTTSSSSLAPPARPGMGQRPSSLILGTSFASSRPRVADALPARSDSPPFSADASAGGAGLWGAAIPKSDDVESTPHSGSSTPKKKSKWGKFSLSSLVGALETSSTKDDALGHVVSADELLGAQRAGLQRAQSDVGAYRASEEVAKELGPWRFADESVDAAEDTNFVFLDPSHPRTVAQRRKYFCRTDSEGFTYDPDTVYAASFHAPFCDLNTLDLSIGPVKMNIAEHFTKMPIRYTLRSTRLAPRPDGQEGPLEEECFATISFRLVD
ncbi:hypothetical protein JCM3775_005360 [Rhodotorula graminis]